MQGAKCRMTSPKFPWLKALHEVEVRQRSSGRFCITFALRAATTGMAASTFVTNDEVRNRILNVYAKFVSDVEPDRLSDWLVQEHVITIEQKQRIRLENTVASDRCRAILDHLFSIQHPRAFLVVRQALRDDNHYLLETIDNQEPGPAIRVQPEEQTVLHARIQELENDLVRYRSVNSQLRTTDEDLKQRVHQLESEFWSDKSRIQHLEKYIDDQKRASEAEQDRRLKRQNELETKLHTAKVTIQKLEKDKEDKKSARESETNRLLHTGMPREPETNLHVENLRSDYDSNPVLVQRIKTKASKKGKDINGLAILGKELFVINSHSSKVEVYESIKFSFIRQLNLKKLNHPLDIVSCNRNECLYIFDFKGPTHEILRVDPNENLIKKWITGDDCGLGLSITDESNVILTVLLGHKLMEYSPDGVLVREISLLLASCAGLRYPRHAIKLTNGDFVISHGFKKDDLLSVWLVDSDGKRKKSFDTARAPSIGLTDYPSHLSIDGNGFVLVADPHNGRVLLLDSELEFKMEILSKGKDGLRMPSKIVLEESNRRMIVADNCLLYGGGRILVFDFK